MAISRGYPKSEVHWNIFSSLIATGILLPEKPNYQADFVNYKNNFPGKVINETFRQKKPQRKFFMAQASG